MTEDDLEFSDCYERDDYLKATKKDRWNQAKENLRDALFHWLGFKRAKFWLFLFSFLLGYFHGVGPFFCAYSFFVGTYLASLFKKFYNYLKI